MKTSSLKIAVMMWLAVAAGALAQAADPVVLGRGVGLFEVGEVIESDDFSNLNDWVVQMERVDGADPSSIDAAEGKLNCLVPDRGCTIWFKKKLRTRTVITYDVMSPAADPAIKGMEPSDLNQFWMASDPEDREGGLFDAKRYTGGFLSYHKMHGYYASTGGGRNSTTRFRRYPREVDGKPADHLALSARDGDKAFMIIPDKVMEVQLVAYDDVVQYIVDGKLVYEVGGDDAVQVEFLDDKGRKAKREATYSSKDFPAYKEGFFGFRMVKTHHVYSNFRVHALEPARKKVEVDSIESLRAAASKSHQDVVMKPGVYELKDLTDGGMGVRFTGSNNHFDLTGVTLRTPLQLYQVTEDRRRRGRGRSGQGSFEVTGNHVTLEGGNFENTYRKPLGKITDFGAYNQDPDNYPRRGVTEMRLRGDDLKLINCRFRVLGSFPYGYGNMYGIGGGAVLPLRKHCGVLITGDRVIVDGCYVKMEAFGHAIFVQGGDQITVRNTEVEGEVRPSNELYKETDDGDLAKRFNYQLQWPDDVEGLPIPKDHMINLTEDGIRAYGGTGHMTVENCKVTKCRGGIKLYMAKSATVTDCEVRDCVIQGFSVPSRGTIMRCRGNAAYGPLLYIHMDSHSSQKIDLEVLPAPHALGDHPLAAIKGQKHRIRFTSKEPLANQEKRPIIIGYALRFDFLTVDYPKVPAGFEKNFEKYASDSYRATNILMENRTLHPVVLGEYSRENRLGVLDSSRVTDLGRDNSVKPFTAADK